MSCQRVSFWTLLKFEVGKIDRSDGSTARATVESLGIGFHFFQGRVMAIVNLPHPKVLNPPEMKTLIAGLIKGNQWLIVR